MKIIPYIVVCCAIILVFLYFRKVYKKYLRGFFFPKKVAEEELKGNIENNKLYQEKKHRKLIKQKMLRKKQQENTHPYKEYKEDLEIVDIAKPVGKWTKMVMFGGGLMQRLTQLISSEEGKKGFWELFVKAQASTKGKYKGKGR